MTPTSTTELDPGIRAFLAVPRVATLATVTADGDPVQAVIWFRLDPDDTVLVNSRLPRRWPTALRHSRRASLAITDARDGMRWVGLDCRVAAIDEDVDRAYADIAALADRYGDDDPATLATYRTQRRLSFRLAITRVHAHLDE